MQYFYCLLINKPLSVEYRQGEEMQPWRNFKEDTFTSGSL